MNALTCDLHIRLHRNPPRFISPQRMRRVGQIKVMSIIEHGNTLLFTRAQFPYPRTQRTEYELLL